MQLYEPIMLDWDFDNPNLENLDLTVRYHHAAEGVSLEGTEGS
jgi:hypothetical protein